MKLAFEKLQQRNLLAADLRPHVEAPLMAFKGDEVTYVITVVNQGDQTGVSQVKSNSPVEDPKWTLDGVRIDSLDQIIELDPQASEVFTLTGRVPEDGRWSLYLEVSVSRDRGNGYRVAEHSTVILDSVVDSDTLAVIVASELHANVHDGFTVGYRHDGYTWAGFHSAEPAGDVNGDGINDVFLNYVNPREVIVDGEEAAAIDLVRHTVFGASVPLGELRLRATSGDVLDTWPPGLAEAPSRFLPTAPHDGGRFPVGDVDNDGFNDVIWGNPRDLLGVGTAKVLLGPDFRDNFLILGNASPNQPGADVHFGQNAGAVGDINGDGFDDFYVVSNYFGLNIIFGRELIGDFDADGAVTLNDFFIIADNFGSDVAVRNDGDLDGDSRITFSDFLIFSSIFARVGT